MALGGVAGFALLGTVTLGLYAWPEMNRHPVTPERPVLALLAGFVLTRMVAIVMVAGSCPSPVVVIEPSGPLST